VADLPLLTIKAMEDRHCHDTNISANDPDDEHISFFGVFDGHAGELAAEFIAEKLPKNLVEILQKNPKLSDIDIIQLFYNTDEELRAIVARPDLSEYAFIDPSGTTACTCLVHYNKKQEKTTFTCANTGDSRCVLYDSTSEPSTTDLSRDHKPYDEEERKRIYNAGGFLQDDRINGNLAVGRSFGDFIHKCNFNKGAAEQALVCTPEIMTKVLTKNEEKGLRFLLIACDGLWDVMTSEEATKYIAKEIDMMKRERESDIINAFDLEDIVKKLMIHAVQDLDSGDNVSVLLVKLH
jgi:protein phosphatase 2C family protein 2/3